jgi:hypothetical protein
MSIEELNEQIASLDQQIEKIRLLAHDKIKKLKDKRDKLSQQKNQIWLKSFDEIGLDKIPSDKIFEAIKKLKEEHAPDTKSSGLAKDADN